MERYTLIFDHAKKDLDPSLLAAFDELRKNHRHEGNCDACKKKDECLLRDGNQPRPFFVVQCDEFSQLKGFINQVYPLSTIIVLIDDKEDVAYIYKGKGSLKDFKKKTLTTLIKMYEHAFKNANVFLKIEDIRDAMHFRDTSINGDVRSLSNKSSVSGDLFFL